MTTRKRSGPGTGVSRRDALVATAAGIGVASAVSVGSRQAKGQSARRTFVLIHGAWHGGWCWRPVADILEAKGHKVFAPSLTGLADRSHLLTSSVDLETHITDIVNLFQWESIENAVLVGHSYGGWPISGAAEKLIGKIASIVYLDAFVPENGQRGIDLSSSNFQASLREAIAKGELGRPVPKAEAFRILDAKNAAWVQSKMTPQPTKIATSAITLSGARDRIAKKAYVRASAYPQPSFDKFLAAAKADKSWRTYEFSASEAGHDIMVDAPQRLAQILMEVA